MEPVFRNCNVCGRDLVREDELAIGMCAICANEEVPDNTEQAMTDYQRWKRWWYAVLYGAGPSRR